MFRTANRPFRLLVQGNRALKPSLVASDASLAVPAAVVRKAVVEQRLVQLHQLGRNAMRGHPCTISR